MSLRGEIEAHREQNPGSVNTDRQLTAMLTTLDRMVQVELLHSYPVIYETAHETAALLQRPGVLVDYRWEADQQTALLLERTPFDDLYGLYLGAMVFFHQNEWTKYENSKELFNARYAEACAYYSRTRAQERATRLHNHW